MRKPKDEILSKVDLMEESDLAMCRRWRRTFLGEEMSYVKGQGQCISEGFGFHTVESIPVNLRQKGIFKSIRAHTVSAY